MEERTRPVVVAVDGSAADQPVLTWAAEEAESTQRPLVITHAAGHLPPLMTFTERHTARQQRREQGQRVVDRAAEWVRRQAPEVPLETVVRLLDVATLLPAVRRDAHTLTLSGEAWRGRENQARRAPVVALAEESILDFASGYADRHGVELVVVDGHAPDVARRLLEPRNTGSLLLLPRPGRSSPQPRHSWSVVLEIVARSQGPVALVAPAPAPTPRDAAAARG